MAHASIHSFMSPCYRRTVLFSVSREKGGRMEVYATISKLPATHPIRAIQLLPGYVGNRSSLLQKNVPKFSSTGSIYDVCRESEFPPTEEPNASAYPTGFPLFLHAYVVFSVTELVSGVY